MRCCEIAGLGEDDGELFECIGKPEADEEDGDSAVGSANCAQTALGSEIDARGTSRAARTTGRTWNSVI